MYVSVALDAPLVTAVYWFQARHVMLDTLSGHGMPTAYGKL